MDQDSARWPLEIEYENIDEEERGANPWLLGFGGQGALEEEIKEGSVINSPGEADQGITEEGGDPDPEATKNGALHFTLYKEGTGSDKRLELTNFGSIAARECGVVIYSNGSVEPWRTLLIAGPIAPGASIALCTESEASAGCTYPATGSPYNGDDALVVECDGKITDRFGEVGQDPGTGWRGAGPYGVVSSVDSTLIRCAAPHQTTQSEVFSIEREWLPAPTEPVAIEKAAVPSCESLSNPQLGLGGLSGSE